ncbi:TPA: ATP-binding protein [Candidatus Micrarchaeota archaeon]|nr:ATP-binding protein [Candidatus Micrarchaeota archaeon]
MLWKFEFPRHKNGCWSIDMFTGNTGSGKSYTIGKAIEDAYDLGLRFTILDTKTKNHIGLAVLKGVKIIKIKPNYRYNLKRFLQYDQLIVIPSLKMPTERLIEEIYKPLLMYYFDYDSNRILVIEEAHRYNPSSRRAGKELDILHREGRGKNLYLIESTQRIATYPKDLFQQIQRVYLFRHWMPNDKLYLRQLIPNFDELNDSLRPHDFIEFNTQTGEYRLIRREYIIRRTKHYG